MTRKIKPPAPLFDTLENSAHFDAAQLNGKHSEDHQKALGFLKSYNGSSATFNAYRREVERLLHWTWLFAKKISKRLKTNGRGILPRFLSGPAY